MRWIFGAIVMIIIGLSGCAGVTTSVPSTKVTQVSGDIYEIMDVDYRGIFGSETSLKEQNVELANTFASERNKVAVPLMARIHRIGTMGDWAWFYYKFSLATPDSPDAMRKFTDITVERDARLSEEFYQSRNKEISTLAYDELLKLEDLRKRGILTDSEFQVQKTKLLNR